MWDKSWHMVLGSPPPSHNVPSFIIRSQNWSPPGGEGGIHFLLIAKIVTHRERSLFGWGYFIWGDLLFFERGRNPFDSLAQYSWFLCLKQHFPIFLACNFIRSPGHQGPIPKMIAPSSCDPNTPQKSFVYPQQIDVGRPPPNLAKKLSTGKIWWNNMSCFVWKIILALYLHPTFHCSMVFVSCSEVHNKEKHGTTSDLFLNMLLLLWLRFPRQEFFIQDFVAFSCPNFPMKFNIS